MSTKVAVPPVRVGDRLRAARLERRFHPTLVASLCDVTALRLLMIEHHVHDPTAAEIDQLAQVYEVPLRWIFGEPAQDRSS